MAEGLRRRGHGPRPCQPRLSNARRGRRSWKQPERRGITLLATIACRAHACRLTDNDKTVIADRVAGVPVRQLCRSSVGRIT